MCELWWTQWHWDRFLSSMHFDIGARGGVVVKALRYKPRVRFQMVSLDFFSDIILPVALGSTQPLTEMSTRCISWV